MLLKKFLKSQQFKMICSILLILFLSILVKMSIPDSFEHLKDQQEITFHLQFKEAIAELDNFKFSVKDKDSVVVEGDISEGEVDFKDLSVSNLPKNIELTVTSDKYENIDLSVSGEEITKTDDSIFTIPRESIDDSGKSESILLTADLKAEFK